MDDASVSENELDQVHSPTATGLEVYEERRVGCPKPSSPARPALVRAAQGIQRDRSDDATVSADVGGVELVHPESR